MKKKMLSMVSVLVFIMGLLSVSTIKVQASEGTETLPMIDGSYLTHDDESTGYDTKITRGQYLLAGYSKCVKAGEGKIYAGGTTIATQTVDEVGLSVMVERAQEDDDHWTGVTSWQKFKNDADRLSENKYIEVEGGYYYRVRCVHSANSDVSSSFTDGVYIE